MLVGFAVLLTALALFAPVAWWLEERHDAILAERGISVDAEVIDTAPTRRGPPDRVVAYDVGGEERIRTVDGRERIGEFVQMRVDPVEGRADRRADSPNSLAWALWLGALTVPASAALWWQARSLHRRRDVARRRWEASRGQNHGQTRTKLATGDPGRTIAIPASSSVRRRLRFSLVALPLTIPLTMALLSTEAYSISRPGPQLALAGALLALGLGSRASLARDGTLTTRTFGLRRSAQLGQLVEVGGRDASQFFRREASRPLTETLLLRDARGGRVAITKGMWRDEDELLDGIRAYVLAGDVPLADPAARALGLRSTGDVPPDLRAPLWAALLPAVFVVSFALLWL